MLDGAMETIALEPVDSLTVTMLVDNVTDSLLADQGPAKRAPMAARRGCRRASSKAARPTTRCAPSTGSRRW